MSKNETIKNTLKQTKERRKEQACRSFIVKVDKSHLSQQKLDNLNKLFLEAKWFYNYAIANDPFGLDYKIKSVMVKVKDKFEERPLTILSSQMKQEILYDAQDSIINLSKKKANGGKVGQLKFKSYTQSIPLKQFGNTYKIINGKYIKIQNIKGLIKVHGLAQIPEYAEIANARLIHKHGDYFLRIVTYAFKKDLAKEEKEKGCSVPEDNSAIGGLISALEERTHTPIAVNRSFPSTKRCCICHDIKVIQLNDRLYVCECGNIMNRDFNSANNILDEGLFSVPMDDRDFKPAETMAATLKMLGYFRAIPHVKASLVSETGSLTALA